MLGVTVYMLSVARWDVERPYRKYGVPALIRGSCFVCIRPDSSQQLDAGF